MINVDEIEWGKVRGLVFEDYQYSNQGENPIIWNPESKKVEVLEDGKPFFSYDLEQVKDVLYQYAGFEEEEFEYCDECGDPLLKEDDVYESLCNHCGDGN